MVRAEWTGSNLRPVAPEQETADYLGAHDLTAAFTADRSAFSPKLRERLARWMDYTGNSPCVVTWSGGNEMAAGDADVRLYCTRLYEFLRDHDPQGRPFAPSSGLHWERGDAELRGKPLPCGYLDYHNYEMIQRRWIGAAKSYTKEYDDLGRIYGGVECPVVLGEWLAHGGMEDRLCVITPEAFDGDGNPTVGGYVKLITDVTKQHEPYSHHRVSREYLARLAVGGSRIARTYQDDAEARARYYQRSIEIFRRDCPREVGYSIHGMSPFILRKVGDKRAAGEYGSPELEALRMAQQPLIAIPDFWQKHIVAEEGLSFTAHVINWSRQDFAGRLHVRLARDGAEAVTDSTMRVQALKVGERVEIPVEMRFGPAAASGEYELLLDLRREGRTVSRNAHRVLVRRRADFAPLDTTRRVALYEVPDGTDTAAGLMASVGIEPRRLSDLGDLSGVDVLVLGRDSLDAAVSRNARTLRQLAEAGGTIVAFEQSVSAKVPWAPALYYESCGPVPNADPLQLRHPIFRDLAPLDFEDWGAEHVVYSSLIQPLGHNVVAGGAGPRTGFAHTSPADFGMVVAEFRMGDGACLLSQLRITTNYETDSAARTVGYNMLRYALASAWDATKIRALEGDEGGVSDEPILSRDEVLLVNFLAKCNRSTADADGSGWFGMRIGLGDLPEGVKLFGGVPFSIRTASTTRPHTAIVLGSSDRHPEPAFPTEMKEVGIWNYVTKLYFLHTSAYTTPDDGEEVLRYVIHYSSGEPAIFPVRNRIEIADWAYVGVLGITGVLGEASE